MVTIPRPLDPVRRDAVRRLMNIARLFPLAVANALRALETRTSFGVYEEPDFRQVHRLDERRPNFIRITTNYDRETGTFGFCEGFDGAAWEYSFGVPSRVGGMPATALRHASEFDPPYTDHDCKGNEVTWRGRTRFLDQDVYRLTIGGTDYFFDVASLLMVMSRSVVPFHGEGREEEIVDINSDFRPVNGVLMPHRIVQKVLPSGEVRSTLVWEEILGNVDIPDSWFSPPRSKSEEQYDVFRRIALEGDHEELASAHDEYVRLATREADQRRENSLNALGYELLSHERFGRAIRVLELAIEQFPASANLYDSLGRPVCWPVRGNARSRATSDPSSSTRRMITRDG